MSSVNFVSSDNLFFNLIFPIVDFIILAIDISFFGIPNVQFIPMDTIVYAALMSTSCQSNEQFYCWVTADAEVGTGQTGATIQFATI